MGPTIKLTTNLILRIEDDSKAGLVLDLYNRNRTNFERFEPTRPAGFYTLDYHILAMRREYKAYMLGSFLRYYIYHKNDETKVIGAINFNLYFDGQNSFAEIGYKIDEHYQGHGYAYEACAAAINVISNNYNIHRIDARIHPDNIPSLCLAHKLGFKFSVLEPQSANINGRYEDLIRYTCII